MININQNIPIKPLEIFIDTETGFFKINEKEYQVTYIDGVKKSNPT